MTDERARRHLSTFSLAVTALALGALALGAAAVAAQPWVGTAAVGVQVSDRSGKAVAGAEVELVFAEGDDGGGPGAVTTDAEGRASVRGLAEGRWLVQVRHPGYMAYLANVQVRVGRRPKEENATQVKVGDSLESVRLRYFEVEGGRVAPPPPRPAPPPRQSPPPPPPEPRPAPAPAPAPAPMPAPAPAPAPMPQPVPAPAPPPEPMPEPAPMPAPEPEPVPAPMAEPVPAPAPAVAPLPGVEPGSLRSFRDGTCPECQPGEWVATAEATADGQGVVCPVDLEARASTLAFDLNDRAGAGEAVASHAGDLGPIGAIAAWGRDGSRCRVLAVHLPERARFVGFQYEARSGGGWAPCIAGEVCPVGGGRWVANPALDLDAVGTLLVGAYENREGAGEQAIRFSVFFVPPSGWNP